MYIYVFLDEIYMPYAYCITDRYFDDGKLVKYSMLGNKKAVLEVVGSTVQLDRVYKTDLTSDYYFDEDKWCVSGVTFFLTKNDLEKLTRVDYKDIDDVMVMSILIDLNTYNYIGCSSSFNKAFNYRQRLHKKGIVTTIEKIICKCSVKELYYSDLSIAHEKDDKIDLSTELDDNMIAKYLLLH